MTSVTARIAAWAAPTFRICREQIPHLPPVSRKVSANIRFFGYQRILSDSSVTVAPCPRTDLSGSLQCAAVALSHVQRGLTNGRGLAAGARRANTALVG